MTFKVGTAALIKYNHGTAGATVAYRVIDESGGLFGSAGTLTESSVYPGLYEGTFTPDAAGFWTVCILVGTAVYAMVYPVEVGLIVDANTDIETLIARLTAARAGYLDNLSAGAAALETTLTAIKGSSWSTETLKVIKDAITALNNLTDVQVWSYATRALTDKAGFSISGTKTTLDALSGTDGDTLKTLSDQVDGVAAKTNIIGASVALESSGNVAAIKTRTDLIPTAVASGLVVTDAGNSTTQFKTDLTEATDDHYNGMILVFTSGSAVGGQARKITDYVGATKIITIDTALAAIPTVGDGFQIAPNYIPAGDATAANQALILGDIGDASASTLGSLYAILGNPATTIVVQIATIDGIIDAINTNLNTLIQQPQCDSGMGASATTIVCADLAGYGEDYFNVGWKMIIVLNDNSHGAAPQGEIRDITDYASVTGTFTTVAFSANVEANDYIMVVKDEVLNLKKKTWFSDASDVINLPATATDINLSDVVLPNITGTIVRVYVGIKFRMIENTSASGANAIQGAQNIRIKKSSGAWGTDDIAAINLADNQWTVAASTREGGDIQMGDNDVVSEVDAFNATYNLRFEDADVDYDYLRLNDVQVFLIVEWF